MSWIAFTGAVELGLIFALLALGIFVAYRILGVPDLTVEGSFTAGAATGAIFVAAGQPLLGIGMAVAVGTGAGIITAFLQTKMRIQPILAGILTMTALYSVSLAIMGGRPNIPLFREETLFTIMERLGGGERMWRMLLPLIVVLTVGAVLGVFFHTRLGLAVRATGDNEEMVRASSINTTFTKTVGLAMGNAVAALCGGLMAQYQGFADINMGFGMVVVALASLIIGETVFGRRTVVWNIGAVMAGAVIYRIILALALSVRLNPANLRAISALIVAAAISYPAIKNWLAVYKLKRRERRA
jgi:putative ABC transport system permease protein